MQSKLGWHIVAPNGRLGFNDRRPVIVGERMQALDAFNSTLDCPWFSGYRPLDPYVRHPKICMRGMHASVNLVCAIKYATMLRIFKVGAHVCRVRILGKIYDGGDKIVGMYREVLWAITLVGMEYHFLQDKYYEQHVLKRISKIKKRKGRKITSGILGPSRTYATPTIEDTLEGLT